MSKVAILKTKSELRSDEILDSAENLLSQIEDEVTGMVIVYTQKEGLCFGMAEGDYVALYTAMDAIKLGMLSDLVEEAGDG